jgi:DNA-binding CsgD family transcriptional regulator
MDNRFIIIHPFEIIRKGLWSILRETFHYEFILLPSLDDLKDYSGLSHMQLLILIGDSLYTPDSEVKIKTMLGSVNRIKIMRIGQNEAKPSSTGITFEMNASKIIELVKNELDVCKTTKNQFNELTEREKEVLALVALGHPNKEIADKLFISIHTVISHRKNITEKLGIKSISGLTVYAILNKLIDTENIDPATLI